MQFLVHLLVGFSPAQLRHALNCVETLLVCTSQHKALSALTRLLRVPHADHFALADFFRSSPWESASVQRVLGRLRRYPDPVAAIISNGKRCAVLRS